MGYWSGYGYPRYVTVAEKKAKAARKLAQLKKKNPDIKPVVITGRSIAITWWGKSWNTNLEQYADYSNRIGRGRSYVRHGSVLDLKINPGEVTSLVQGTSSQPYKISVKIGKIQKDAWEEIKDECKGKLDSLPELLEGKIPKALKEVLTAKGRGLFPSPDEIKFSCSCPDWASMCKHVAATLYGIGARLDDDPLLFFKLRNADVNELISETLHEKTEKLLKNADKKSGRVLNDVDLGDMFGIEIDESDTPGKSEQNLVAAKKKPKKAAGKSVKKVSKKSSSAKNKNEKTKASAKKASTGKQAAAKKSTRKSPGKKPVKTTSKMTSEEIVTGYVMRTRKGIDFPTLEKKTGIDTAKIYNIIYKLLRQGKIEKVARGVYKKA